MSVRRLLVFIFLIGVAAVAQKSKQLTVAAASDMSFALKEIASLYDAEHKVQVRLVFGASGNLYQQIRSGLPADVFLSADEMLPQKLADAGLGRKESVRRYATGSLVLWVPATSQIDVAALGDKALLDARVNRVAIANPRHAPYGLAAKAALRSLKVWEQIRPKLVLGESISQTTQFVQSGNADIGFISLSHALSAALKGGRYWRVPTALHPPIQQGLIVLSKKGRDVQDAQRFADFLDSAAARNVLTRYGFELPLAPSRIKR